jgi:hypothetical protein
MTILTKTMDEGFPGWISSETLEPHNYWSTTPIQACNTILERAWYALQHRLLLKSIKRHFFPTYSGIGREVVQTGDYYGNFRRIEGSGLPGFLTNFRAILNENYAFERVV